MLAENLLNYMGLYYFECFISMLHYKLNTNESRNSR
jgi:hypothetical protein